ncbi:hypothetical protein [Halobacterium wangiae]|uniref:hypothetical protein n=1 Tax=Halobacterium wangiae TaxID=2902623 RepID=UPI001E61DAEF|nr:hypothetical protein [Halobacterium wangiae]
MDRTYLRQAVGLVALSTVVLTAAFVGVVALAQGLASGAAGRVPFYALGGAVVFVATLVTLEDPEEGGVPILTSTVAVTVLGFALLALGGEGVIYGARDPGRLGTSLVLYFVAAALVCTGTVYWGLNHWREFTA